MNQAIWNLFELKGKPFSFINIYISNHALDRCALWWWIAMNVLMATWILYRYFNMVEKASDKKIIFLIRWVSGEREAFYFIKNKLSLYNPNFFFYF